MEKPTVGQKVVYNICPDGSGHPMEKHPSTVTKVHEGSDGDAVDLEVEDLRGGGKYESMFVPRGTTQGTWSES